ncbi:MAG: AMP-binding protein [Acidobacteria bacterium]|jgi:long-chain acyl-CoA synthetase|nr:AMP-binding protein [Acidobacteriota bacterium]
MARNTFLKENTINCLLETSVERFGTRPALGMALETPLSYSELFSQVSNMAAVLKKQGVRKGDRVAILGENSPNWCIACLASMRIGAIVVPVLPDFPEADIHHILLDSEAKILFTTQRQVEKVLGLREHKLLAVITLDDFSAESDLLTVEPISKFVEKARNFLRQIPDKIGLKSTAVGADDVASIIYTSGTSGHSKAVLLTHGNFIANVLTTSNYLLEIQPGWTFLSILPLSHTYEFTLGFLFPLLNGSRIAYVGKTPTPSILEKICKVEKPEVIAAVPLIMEKIYKKKVLAAFEKKFILKLIAKVPGLKLRIYRKIADKLVEFFGGELKTMAIGGAAINREAEMFLKKSGFPYLIGYGLTESAPLLAGGPWADPTIAVGSTGKPIPGVEIRIADPDPKTGIGEILARGPNIMQGYYNNPQATREALDDEGWLHTGDLGNFDKANNLFIRGRSKNMILKSNGENIYPEAIEDKINSCIHVMESLVMEVNGQLEAWVYLDYDLIDEETRGRNQQQKLEYIDEVLLRLKETINPQLSAFAQIGRFVEHKEPFEKTATSKIKRYLYAH